MVFSMIIDLRVEIISLGVTTKKKKECTWQGAATHCQVKICTFAQGFHNNVVWKPFPLL